MTLYYPPTQNGLQKELDAQLDQGTTSAMTLNNVTGVQNKPGVVVINRIDSGGTEKDSSDREYIIYTGTSGNTLTGLTRGQAGSSDQDHAVGSVVEFIPDILQQQGLIDTITAEHETDGTHSTDAIDAITEIAAGLKSGDDTTLITGTAGTDGYTAKWNADGDLVDGYEVLDEDDMSSDSATKLATQQSIKAYVDTQVGAIDVLPDTAIEIVIDGGGVQLETGVALDLEIPFDCTINGYTALADQSGSVQVDLWVDTYANYPPTDADSITASAPISISSDDNSQDTTLTGWTTSLTEGQTLRVNVDSVTTITRLTISLDVTKT